MLQTFALLAALAPLAAPLTAQPGTFTWVSAGGPYAGTADFVHFDWAILALHRDGVSRTENGGRTWDLLPDAPPGLRNARREPGVGTVFASDDGLVSTADAGRTWQRLGPAGIAFQDHARLSDGTHYALGSYSSQSPTRLYRLEGGQWVAVATDLSESFRALWLYSTGQNGVLVLTTGAGLQAESADGGMTWEAGPDIPSGTYTDVLELSDGQVALTYYNVVYTVPNDITVGGAVLRSASGETHRVSGIGHPSFGVTEAFGELYVGTSTGVYRIENAVAEQVLGQMRARDYAPVAPPGSGASDGAVVSTERFFTPVFESPVPRYPQHGVYRIAPDGSRIQRGITGAAITDLNFDSDGRLLATAENGVYRLYGTAEGLDNEEQRWERLPYDGGAAYGVNRYGSRVLFLTEAGYGPWSADGSTCSVSRAYDAVNASGALLILMGFNWFGTAGGVLRVPYNVQDCETLLDYIGYYGELVLDEYTGDGLPGFGLRELNRMTSGVVLVGAHEPLFGYEEGYGTPAAPIYYSADEGLTWAAAAVNGDPEVYDFLTNDAGQLWAGTDDGLLTAGPDGAAWTATDLLRGRAVYDLHRDADGAPLAGTDAGAFRFDGAAWQPHGLGLEGRKVYTFRTLADSTLVAGTDRGVWSSAPLTSVSAEPEPAGPAAAQAALGTPFPNPAAGRVTVPVLLSAPAPVRVEVLDVLGRTVAVEELGLRGAGTHAATFDVGSLAPGLYVVRLAGPGALGPARRFTVVR